MIGNKKSVCFAMVKNEEDIIELFIRHNLHFFEHIFIVDNNSSDDTVKIINLLIKENLPVTLWHDDSLAHLQSRITTNAYHRIAKIMDFDLFFPLDADELLIIENDFCDTMLDDHVCFITGFSNYVTMKPDDTAFNMTRRINQIWHGKVFFRHDKKNYKKIKIAQGNHSISNNIIETPVEMKYLPTIRICHFYARGINHYLRKYTLGAQSNLVADKKYITGHGKFASHWYQEYQYIKEKKFKISFSDYLKRLYNLTSNNPIEELALKTVEDPIFFDVELKYTKNETNLNWLLVQNFEELSKLYWNYKHKSTRFIVVKNKIIKNLKSYCRSIMKRLPVSK